MIEKFISYVLASATLSTLALAALSFLLREWITERLKNSIKHEYDREMESYKGMLARVHAATAEGQKAAIERRMKAFDRMWKTMLSIREGTGAYTFHLDIRTEAEWRDLPSSATFRNLIGTVDDGTMLSLMGDRAIEEDRPYVGEVVWALFFAYRSFNVRLVHLARQSLSTPDSILWSEDVPTRDLLAATLSDEEIAEFDTLQISKVHFVRRTIEGKVLSAWHKLISGAEFGEEALRHAHTLLKFASRSAPP